MTAEKSSRIAAIAKAGEDAAKKVPLIQGREFLNEFFKKFGIAHYQTGNEEADIIEDWTTLLLWVTEKGVKRELLTKDENTIMMGILCAAAECLTRHAGENKAFCMMLTANAANRAFFTQNPMRPTVLYELASEQRGILGEYSEWREYVADIARAIDELFATREEKVRAKIAVAVNGLLRSAWSVLAIEKKRF